jgi:hypothetical protein
MSGVARADCEPPDPAENPSALDQSQMARKRREALHFASTERRNYAHLSSKPFAKLKPPKLLLPLTL